MRAWLVYLGASGKPSYQVRARSRWEARRIVLRLTSSGVLVVPAEVLREDVGGPLADVRRRFWSDVGL